MFASSLILSTEAYQQEILPKTRYGKTEAEITCPGAPPKKLEINETTSATEQSPWYKIISVPITNTRGMCSLKVEVPALLSLNKTHKYVKKMPLWAKTVITEDTHYVIQNISYTMKKNTLFIPLQGKEYNQEPYKIELLVATSLKERIAFFRKAMSQFLEAKNHLILIIIIGIVMIYAAKYMPQV